MKIWLDDIRPAPKGWVHLRTIAEVKGMLLYGNNPIEEMSLDHDLGIGPPCPDCENLVDNVDHRLDAHIDPETGGCECQCHEPLPSGSDLVLWMAENNLWPKTKPRVHSANPVGRAYMEAVINRYFLDDA